MKKVLTLFILLKTLSFCYAQDNTIIYDFQKNEYIKGSSFKVKNDKKAQFKISNINRFLYDISVSASKSNYSNSKPPSEFTKALTSNVSSTTGSQTEDQNKSLTPSEEVEKPPSVSQLGLFENTILALNKIALTYNGLVDISKLDNSFDYVNNLKKNLVSTSLNSYNSQELITFCNKKISEALELNSYLSRAELSAEDKKKYDNLKSEFEKANFKETITKLIQLDNEINESNFTFLSEPVLADFDNADEIKFKIEIKSKDNSNTGKNREFEIPVTIVEGVRIDFSAGIFGTNIFDHNFSTVKDSVLVDTAYHTGYKIVQNNQGNFNLGINTLMHVSYKWRGFGAGLNFGVGLMGDPQTLRYLLGGSLILGNQRRFILNGGLCFGAVNRLSSTKKENTFYEGDQPSTVPTDKKTSTGWYLGVSYNF